MSDSFNTGTQATSAKKDFGFLIRVKNKRSDRHPDFEGSIPIEGKEYRLSGWIRVSKKGNKYLSLSARLSPDQDQEQTRGQTAPLLPHRDLNRGKPSRKKF